MLHIRLKVKEVLEEPTGYIKVYAVLESFMGVPEPKREKARIVSIGLPPDEDMVAQQMMGQVAEVVEKRLGIQRLRPLDAAVCFWLKKEYFERLGRPTVNDYIMLDARSYRP